MLKRVGRLFLWLMICGALILVASPFVSIILDKMWDFLLK